MRFTKAMVTNSYKYELNGKELILKGKYGAEKN